MLEKLSFILLASSLITFSAQADDALKSGEKNLQVKIEAIDSMANFLKEKMRIEFALTEAMNALSKYDLSSFQSKRIVYNLLRYITYTMRGGFEVKSSKDSLNFFTMVVSANEIPFYLLEIDCPSEVNACAKQPAPMLMRLFQEDISWDEWVYQPRNFLKLFASPSSAFQTISTKTKFISERALEKANTFQSQRPYLELPRARD